MNLRRGVFICLVAVVTSAIGFIGGYRLNPILPIVEGVRAFEIPTRLDIPPLQIMLAGTTTDAQAYAAILAYYDAHRADLRKQFAEQNDDRLKALFVMYLINTSHSYNVVEQPADTLIGYTFQQTASHCLWYSVWQNAINRRFGLTSRITALSDGDHGWVEVQIGNQWEIFDSTVNLWLSASAQELRAGAPRHYRQFALLAATDAAPNALVVRLRRYMIGFGYLYPKPEQALIELRQYDDK